MKRLVALLLLALVEPVAVEAQWFTGTYIIGRTKDLPTRDIDFPLLVLPLRSVVFPAALRGSGVEVRLGVTAWLTEDGRATRVLVTHGSDERLREPVEHAVEGWRFCSPNKNSIPVAALVMFEMLISEDGVMSIAWRTETEPNQSLEPTPAAGTSAAEQPLVPAAVVAHL